MRFGIEVSPYLTLYDKLLENVKVKLCQKNGKTSPQEQQRSSVKLLKQGCLGWALQNNLTMMVRFPGKWYQVQKPVKGTDGILSTKEETNQKLKYRKWELVNANKLFQHGRLLYIP